MDGNGGAKSLGVPEPLWLCAAHPGRAGCGHREFWESQHPQHCLTPPHSGVPSLVCSPEAGDTCPELGAVGSVMTLNIVNVTQQR